jgi:hypothetical protein
MMVRLMGLPARETNSSQASSSKPAAHRQTISFKGKDEYRVGLVVLDISCQFCVFPQIREKSAAIPGFQIR